MEIGSHDRLQEGAPSLNLANGVKHYANDDEAPMEVDQQRQGWVPGPAKVSDIQQPPNWTSRPNTTGESIHHANIEDACNLVAFSATASSRPASTSTPVQQNTSQLYEKFTQEMGEGGQVGLSAGAAKGNCQAPDDLDTLQTALSQAKHGHKPPNCNCDGPDCPDYLEWLEKKIKLATNEDQAPCNKSSAHTQPMNGSSGSSIFPQQQQGSNPQQRPGPKPPIPCSPQVLSIAKERNVSLQTAIAIEALTQLSGTGSQATSSPGHYNNNLHQNNLQNHPPNGHFFSRSQSVPPGLHAAQSIPDQRPQSQGPPPHATPLRSSTSPFPGQGKPPGFNPHPQHPQHWQQGTGHGEQRNMWMGNSQDPMSELKQLLGDNSGKFNSIPFRLPVQQQQNLNQNVNNNHPQNNIALDKIKKEPDSNEHYPIDPYGMANGQPHYPGMPLSPNQAAIRHSTQAALQQHLHYKRNLFSNHSPGFASSRAPNTCQNLKKWWPQMDPQAMTHMAIKQEHKEPKRRKSMQGSPIINPMGGMLTPPPPKPKQIVIKKNKQKASMPLFMPQSQISVQKPLTFSPVQTGLHPGTLPSLPLLGGPLPAAMMPPAPAQSQVPQSLVTQSSTNSENAANLTIKSEAQCNTSTPTTSTTQPSSLSNLISIDPKYEELIRQFEAEFGGSEDPGNQPVEESANSQTNQSQSQNESQASMSTNQSNSSTHDQKMDMKESGDQSKGSGDAPMEEQRERAVCTQPIHQEVERMQQPIPSEDKFCMPCSPFPKRMKFESSGDISVLSTTCYSEDNTPTKDFPASPSLKGFLESPLRYLDTPTKNLLDTPSKDLQAEFPTCTCVEQILEKDEGPYYNHLGAGPTVSSIRTLMESRFGQTGEAIRIEKAVYTGREGKSSRGCPIAKWVIRRGSEKEKLLCLVRQRPGHHCDNAVIIILILAWEGVPSLMADKLYQEISDTLTKYGNPTSRRCGLNDDRTCACQGKDPDKCGASFSFGCSWSMYFNGCKYARSKVPRKFRLQGDHPAEEDNLRDNFQNLATEVAPLYKRLAPQAYSNQCLTESKAPDCRLGLKEGRPFSGVTACMDFCAHAHKDQHNLYNGCTVVCTLTKEDNRKVGEIPEDEQLHVLPLYKISLTDEFGSEEAQRAKMKTGALQVLQAFRREVRKLPEPAKSCRQRRLEAKKAASEKKKNKLLQQTGETPEKAVVKTELRVASSPQPQGNKAVIKQEVKPIIKKEPFNGSLDGYPVQSAEAFYPHTAYYARGGLPSTGQPSAPDPVNGYHPNLPMHYGYYNCPPNALFRPKIRTYEGRKAAQVDNKPDVQSLQACLSHPEQSNVPNNSAYTPNTEYQSRPSSVSSEHRATPLIKQEPMDVPVHDGVMSSPAGGNTPSTTPQPSAWPGHKLNGNIVAPNLNSKQSLEASMLSQDHKQFHQHPQQRASPFPQQWYPGSNTPMGSPAPSPLHVPPPPVPSPQLTSMHHHNMHSASPRPTTPRPTTPRPTTPHPGTPQPAMANSGPVPSQPGTPTPGPPRPWSRPSPSPQPNPWAMAPGGYSPVIKHNNPSGAYPDKMWTETGERSSTPLGLQEKAWKSCGGSVASATPSPAPEGRLFPDALQQTEQACWGRGQESDVESCKEREEEDDEVWSDSEHNFLDPNIGGVAVAPAHGSILIECARRELHATTPLKKPDRTHPTRISLVFYQHKNLNQPMHGLAVWEAKMKLLAERALQRQQEAALLGLSQDDIKALGKKRKWGSTMPGASPGPGQSKDKKEGPVTRLAPTFHTTSMVQVSPYAFTQLTGPYSRFV
ncbi:methylcytosine dioxygenase TET3 [Periophthalmus magnuspinnatus]|uniref:methylcytosine dioxygenase TET3 n=1 Tax=Periophthalmus magnuspinnatus TaxID=409849 RepID=UPI00145B4FA8|nr:methylcytosine dioxygenase TET3 [Periophthalmus magnuspinnatus]XP_055080126.1 methylcytosine dioxygenase TET3 [Periophthalmus magnuspinnatus]XP_055080127.1 methylcytosine dioxygenase TET3 [Periophthalmus magnuspinnatus]